MLQRGDLAVLAHPAAGRGRVERYLPKVLAALGPPAKLLPATDPIDAVRATRRAVEAGVRAVVAVGGDGTVHLAAQALAGSGVPLGIVPLGTGNDLADALGLPADPEVAIKALLADLDAGRSAPIDAVRATALGREGGPAAGRAHASAADREHASSVGPEHAPEHWLAAILSVGFDSAVNARANRMRWPRGPRRYDLAILIELARLRTYPLTLELDGVRVETPALLAAIGNTRSYGGGMRMCPDADPTDGLLDVTVVAPVSRVELIRVKPRLYSGTHVTHPSVRTFRARRVTIDAPGAEVYADGEHVPLMPLALECVPGALSILGLNLG